MWQFITEYWAGWLCALIGGAILAAIPKIKALWDAVLALLHDRIYTECYRFMELGYITRDGLRNLNYLYKTYHVMATAPARNCTREPALYPSTTEERN